jgi:adenylate kinase family enzyme
MIRTVLSLIKSDRSESGLFVLKDFDKHLENSILLRLFKDLVNLVKNTKNTIVIISPEYKLPKDIEPEAARIVGGYPDEKEIAAVLKETLNELIKNEKGRISLTVDEIQRIIKSLKGLSVQQIRNVINQCFIDDHLIDVKDLDTIESYKKKLFDQEGLLEFCITEDKENIANFDNLKRWLRFLLSPLPEGSFSWEYRAVVKVWLSKPSPRNWDCLFIVSTSEDFIVNISGRQNRILEGAWQPLINCLPCVFGSMRLKKALPHRQENRTGVFLKGFSEPF